MTVSRLLTVGFALAGLFGSRGVERDGNDEPFAL